MGHVKIANILLVLLTLCLAGHASVLVAPNANATIGGTKFSFGVLGNGRGSGFEITFQWDISATQLTPMIGSSITALGVRLPGEDSTITSPTLVGPYTIEMRGSLNPLGSLDSNPANNIAPGGVTVYKATLVIPANSLIGGSVPNPFYLISFSTPYTYSGGDLLVTVTNPAQASVEVDANSPDTIVDTSACFKLGTTGTQCEAQFFNAPISEFQYGPSVPEPASILLLTTGAGMFLTRKRSKR